MRKLIVLALAMATIGSVQLATAQVPPVPTPGTAPMPGTMPMPGTPGDGPGMGPPGHMGGHMGGHFRHDGFGPPPPPPSRAAGFWFRRGDMAVGIRCSETESIKACVDAAGSLMDKMNGMGAPR